MASIGRRRRTDAAGLCGGRRLGPSYRSGLVKKVLLVALVMLLVMIGLPVMMPGMGGGFCTDCPPALGAGQCLLGVLAGLGSVAALASSQRLRRRGKGMISLLRAALFPPPPQLA